MFEYNIVCSISTTKLDNKVHRQDDGDRVKWSIRHCYLLRVLLRTTNNDVKANLVSKIFMPCNLFTQIFNSPKITFLRKHCYKNKNDNHQSVYKF